MIQKSAMSAKTGLTSQSLNFPYGQPPTSSIIDYKQPPFSEVEKYLIGAKYFIIKSSNFENIEASIKNSEWATTKNNEVRS